MARCVVCSKSAGPFYSLHKACLPAYQDTRKCLREKISDYIALPEFSEEFIEILSACKSSEQFSKPHFKELFIKAWQEQAKITVKNSSPDLLAAKKLVQLADGFAVADEDVEEYLYSRLFNLEYLDLLQNKKSLDLNIEVPVDVELASNEVVVWKFQQISKQEQQRYAQEKQWTVFSSVLSTILMKKRYKQLAVKSRDLGTLLVTTQGLHYCHNNVVTMTKFTEIHSITPMKNGIRIQAITKGAMPDTYVTGDGRFTYTLLQYAQGIQS